MKAEREIVAAKAAAEASMSTTPVSSQNQSESAAASQDLTQSIVIDAAPNDTLNGTDVTMSDVNTTMSKVCGNITPVGYSQIILWLKFQTDQLECRHQNNDFLKYGTADLRILSNKQEKSYQTRLKPSRKYI